VCCVHSVGCTLYCTCSSPREEHTAVDGANVPAVINQCTFSIAVINQCTYCVVNGANVLCTEKVGLI
jgi:hypothetical protein